MQIDLNRTDFLYHSFVRLFKVYILMILVLTSFRLIFVGYYADPAVYQSFSSDLFYAFFMGWRYDTIVTSYLIAAPFLLLILGSLIKSKSFFNFLSWISGFYFYFIVIGVLFISICDLGFYSFYQDHLNILFFGLFEDDTEAVLTSIWKNYPVEYAIAGFIIFLFFLYFLISRTFKFLDRSQRSVLNGGFFKFTFLVLIGFILLIGGARGGYSMMVLAPKYADFSKNLFVNQVALNGLITFEKAIKLRKTRTSLDFNMAKAYGYGDDINKAFSDYLEIDAAPTSKEFLINLLERKTPLNTVASEIKPHVIVLVMESFGAHWMQYNSEDFNFLGPLKQHFRDDIYFKNFISSGNGTIGSLMVLATNIPYRNGARFISESRYMQMPLECAAHIPYKDSGYETSFVYGGKLGWRDIGKYFNYQKYHHVEGENHITEGLELKGRQGTEWGLYDEHFFNYILNKLQTAKRPQFVMGLSTSNHPPFEVPESFKAPELKLPKKLEKKISREKSLFIQRFNAFQYANYKLASFIKKIKDSNLGKNTIIAVTGDHNFWGFMNYEKQEAFTKHTVPFYLYIPKSLKPFSVDLNKFGSHEDIMPTLYNLSLSQKSYTAFGEDMFGITNSVAINANIWADKTGIVWKKNHYQWNNLPLIAPVKLEKKLLLLDRQAKSSVVVSDFYLRQKYKENQIRQQK